MKPFCSRTRPRPSPASGSRTTSMRIRRITRTSPSMPAGPSPRRSRRRPMRMQAGSLHLLSCGPRAPAPRPRRSVAAALAAAAHAHASREPAFALMRPPGHHATADRAMGFCYLNQVAIAALAARRDLGAERVAVWDFDAHHCNGTESILFGREGFLVCSVHQAAGYPGTGMHHSDNSRNWALPPKTPRGQHMEALRASLDAVVSFRPDLVLVSAGFDAYARDPITEMSLEIEDFARIGRWLLETRLPAAAILEGGYSSDLPLLVEAFLAAWAA